MTFMICSRAMPGFAVSITMTSVVFWGDCASIGSARTKGRTNRIQNSFVVDATKVVYATKVAASTQFSSKMRKTCVHKQITECQGEEEQSRDGRNRRCAGHACPIQHEVRHDPPVTPVEPEIIAVLVDDKDFSGQLGRERPFPFGHDRLAGADDPGDRIIFRLEFRKEPLARLPALVIGDSKHFAAKAFGDARKAGHQVDFDLFAVGFVQSRDQIVEQPARPAFDLLSFCEGRIAAAKKVAQEIILTARNGKPASAYEGCATNLAGSSLRGASSAPGAGLFARRSRRARDWCRGQQRDLQ